MPSTPISATTTISLPGEPVNWVLGWSLAETTGTGTARVRIYDGTSSSGSMLASVNLAANDSVRDVLAEGLLKPTSGAVYVQVAAGSVEGSIWWA
jgi:hypothetical protein